MSRKFLLLFILLILFSYSIIIQAADPVDISNHWAQDYILNLVTKDVINVYPDGTFKPEENITRGDFATALAKLMNLVPVSDLKFNDLSNYPNQKYINALVENGIINGYPDGTFRPQQPLKKVESVVIILKALGMKQEEEIISLDNYLPFNDVNNQHWASDYVKIAQKLNLIDNTGDTYFYPDRLTSRATAAKFLTEFEDLNGNTGYIADVYPTTHKLSINLLSGDRQVLNFNDETMIGRNNRIIGLDEILKTDKVFFIANENQEVEYIKAYGMVTEEDLATEVSKMTSGILEPDDVKQLSQGNLNVLQPKLLSAVKNQMVEEGLSTEEVEAIMQTDWNKLENLSKDRLAETVAMQTGLPLDITRSLFEGDWEKIKTYAQIEVVQRMVQRVLNSDLVS